MVFLFSHGVLAGFIEWLADAVGKFIPDRVIGDRVRIETQQFTCFFIHERIAPVDIEGKKTIGYATDDLGESSSFWPNLRFREGIFFHTWRFSVPCNK